MTNQQLLTYSLRGLSALIVFLQAIFITNILGAEESGYYFLSLNIIMILSVVASFGLNTYCLKQASLPRNHSGILSIVRASEKKIFIFSILLIFLLILLSKKIALAFALPSLQSIIMIMSFCIFTVAAINTYASTFQGLGKQSITVIINNLLIPLTMIILIGMVSFSQENITVNDIAYYFLISNILAYLVATLIFKSKYRKKASKRHKITKTYSFWGINILSIMLFHGTLVMMGFHLEPNNYSKLSVVVRIINVFSIIHASIMLFYTPEFCRIYDNGKLEDLRKKLKEAIKILLIVSVPLVFSIGFFSTEIMSVFGNDFKSGSWMLSVALVSPIINCFFLPVTMLLTISGYEKNVNRNLFVSVLICLLLGSFVTKFLGIQGAIVILTAAFCIHNIACGISYFRKFRLLKN